MLHFFHQNRNIRLSLYTGKENVQLEIELAKTRASIICYEIVGNRDFKRSFSTLPTVSYAFQLILFFHPFTPSFLPLSLFSFSDSLLCLI